MRLPFTTRARLEAVRSELAVQRERLARVESEYARAEAELGRERLRSGELQAKLERFEDDALFAAGLRPIHHPEAPQYQPRQVSEAELGVTGVTSPLEWRDVQVRLEREAEDLAEHNINAEVEAWAKRLSTGELTSNE